MVKNHSDSEKGNLLLPHRLLFPIDSNGSFKMGDPLVVFSSLWPRETELKNHLRSCGLQLMLIHGAVLDLCRLAVTCGC